jgi:TPR repeat protein
LNKKNIEASYIAAERFKTGDHIQQNIFKAIDIYRMATNVGEINLFHQMNNVISSLKITTKNESQFIKMLENETQNSNPFAMNRLASCYYSGEGVSIDKIKAIELYRKAASLGFKTASHNLMFFDFNFEVNPENESKYIQILESEAQYGNQEAMVRLSYCYLNGIYVPIDESKSQKLIEQAYQI